MRLALVEIVVLLLASPVGMATSMIPRIEKRVTEWSTTPTLSRSVPNSDVVAALPSPVDFQPHLQQTGEKD